MIDQLITALSKEVEMSAAEIADTIWLALQMQEFPSESVSSGFSVKTEDEREIKKPENQLNQQILPKNSELEETPNQSPEEPKAGIYPRNEQQTSKSSNLSFKVPDAPSLREPLTLARALKPLMRRVPSGRELVLDEAATIQRIADEGLWIPILKSAVEPWLDLELVVDESISMQIWRHTIKELERLLKNYGIFRDVRVWGLITDEKEQVQIRRGIGATAKNQTPRSPKELIDPTGRRLVLVVSDCVSSLWRNGELTPVLELWAKQGSMAIVQMLPKWLWKRTALGRASEVRLRGLTPGVFNQKLIAKEVSLWDELDEEMGVKVPVFTLEADKVFTWGQMLSGKGSIWTLGYVFKLDTPVKKERELFNLNHSELNAEQRVQAFRVTVSPMARKLAGLLASAPVISLPIVRLIRESLLKDSQQVHVAEVFLGGLLKPLSEINADTNPDYVQYEFMDGVRDLLVDSVPSEYVLNVVDEVSKYVARKVGLSLEDFAAVLRNPQQARNADIAEKAKYFATVTAQVLRRLGGEYAKVADNLNDYNHNADHLDSYNHDLEAILDELRTILDELGTILNRAQGTEKFIILIGNIENLKTLVDFLLRNSQQTINGDIAEKVYPIHLENYRFQLRWGIEDFTTVTAQVLRDSDYRYPGIEHPTDYTRVADNLDDYKYKYKYNEKINDLTSLLYDLKEILYDLKEILERLEKGLEPAHFSRLRRKITDPEILVNSLRDLGITVKLEADTRGRDGIRCPADIVAVLEGECDLGFLRNGDGSFDLIADLPGVAKKYNLTELVDSIQQKYAVNNTLKDVKQRQEKKENASISMSRSETISSFNRKNKCPRCDSKQTIKYGFFQGKQKYKCQNCGTEFS